MNRIKNISNSNNNLAAQEILDLFWEIFWSLQERSRIYVIGMICQENKSKNHATLNTRGTFSWKPSS